MIFKKFSVDKYAIRFCSASVFLVAIFMGLESNAQSKWSFEVFYSMDKLSGDEYLGSGSTAGYFLEYSAPNFSTGVHSRMSISKNLSLLTGLIYSKQEYVGTFNCPACNTVGDVLPLPKDQRYLQLPSGAEWTTALGKFNPKVEGGLIHSFLISSGTRNQLGNEALNDFYLSAFIGTGIQYNFTEQFGLTAGYRYSKSLSNVFESGFDLNSNNFRLGVTWNILN